MKANINFAGMPDGSERPTSQLRGPAVTGMLVDSWAAAAWAAESLPRTEAIPWPSDVGWTQAVTQWFPSPPPPGEPGLWESLFPQSWCLGGRRGSRLPFTQGSVPGKRLVLRAGLGKSSRLHLQACCGALLEGPMCPLSPLLPRMYRGTSRSPAGCCLGTPGQESETARLAPILGHNSGLRCTGLASSLVCCLGPSWTQGLSLRAPLWGCPDLEGSAFEGAGRVGAGAPLALPPWYPWAPGVGPAALHPQSEHWLFLCLADLGLQCHLCSLSLGHSRSKFPGLPALGSSAPARQTCPRWQSVPPTPMGAEGSKHRSAASLYTAAPHALQPLEPAVALQEEACEWGHGGRARGVLRGKLLAREAQQLHTEEVSLVHCRGLHMFVHSSVSHSHRKWGHPCGSRVCTDNRNVVPAHSGSSSATGRKGSWYRRPL
ncbi:uncharacterized protein LOC110350587 [Heterocephalus glaber]|uniref:Uncharacterized protein LOC110350587 n=1 Tax=Heterocephalus glaber TaxID=10181 RepID=A0AAX6TBG9_HETGA|nr:uncharacterized protein LOC110350587 [Heterocephalus glaber]XP_021119670.1 uncharacterized protein LOC110350587 [Heterocephalus glaber]XP_021119671.1 uncharacterized protein LOC110350587 [Heterocephalus glaber]XP_021119672.1 uncharacterized protein LOC110350587 [Heterocephalus glaber]